jgi:hypothetical protein
MVQPNGILPLHAERMEMAEIVFQVEEDRMDADRVAHASGVGIATQAETLDELKAMSRAALKAPL